MTSPITAANLLGRFLLSLAAWHTLSALVSAQEGSPTNIVLIISDDQGWEDFGFMGHPHIRTPHLDALARESLVYTRGYVAAPLCRPSLASIFSGRHVHEHGITGNDPLLPEGYQGMKGRREPRFAPLQKTLINRIADKPGLAHLLSQRGYLTLQTGKWWEGNPKALGGFSDAMTHGDPKRDGRSGDEGRKIGREGLQPIVDFIAKTKTEQKPFFIWHAPNMPHTPHNPPKRILEHYLDKTDSPFVARYWAMCEWFDETCGELLSLLNEEGLRDNTLILFIVDNGWIQMADNKRFHPRSKQSAYDGGIRTPVIAYWPGKILSSRDESSLVSSIDLAPTILKACGIEPPSYMTGLDLLDGRSIQNRKAVFGADYDHDVYDTNHPTLSLQARFIVQGSWKLIMPHARNAPDNPIELFNLLEDPYEHSNLAQANPTLVKALENALDDWWTGPLGNDAPSAP